MAVLLPDGSYRVTRKAHPQQRDAHGTPIPTDAPPWSEPFDGAASRQLDGTWTLRLDTRLWPLAAGDVLERVDDGARWSVTGTPRRHQVPAAPDVDYIAASAVQTPADVDQGYP